MQYIMLPYFMNQIRTYLLIIILSGLSLSSFSQSAAETAAYQKTVQQRAVKIVGKLGITDSAAAIRVRDIIAVHYSELNTIYTKRDSGKLSPANADSAVSRLHRPFLTKLAADLNADQIVQVKDGLTYGVLPITYTAYQDMLPQLSTEQKNQILIWLTEAREKAMDAESSEKKHGWFKKYKGRINNYLSAAGIDMKKEGEAWQERIRAAAKK